MTPRLFRLVLILWSAVLAAFAGAQMPSPAKWSAAVEPAQAAPGSRVELVLHADIPKPWHVYSLKKYEEGKGPFGTEVKATAGGAFVEAGEPEQSTPIAEKDPIWKGAVIEYYEGSAEFRVPFRLAKTAKGEAKASAEVTYQLCDKGQCLPPTTKTLTATVAVSGAPVDDKTPLNAPKATTPAVPSSTEATSAVGEVANAKAKGLLAYVALAVGAGFLALLTPCVFPMIPITVSFFSKQKEGESPLPKALAYCAGIIGTFTALGVAVAAFFGATSLTTFANNPYLNLVLAVVFVALSFSLFGFFEIGVPSSILTKLDSKGRGGMLGPVLMGLTFSLTSFTCTLPFVGAVLFSASQGDLKWPILGMLGFSTAFCLPFFLLALFPAALSKMPRAGGWLATVKAFMGFVELAAAVKFVSSVDLGIRAEGLGIVTREVFLALWFAIALGAAAYLLGVIKLPHVYESEKIGPFRRLMGVATLVGSFYVLLAINGASLGKLTAFLPPKVYPGREAKGATTDGLVWLSDYDAAVAQAKKEGKPPVHRLHRGVLRELSRHGGQYVPPPRNPAPAQRVRPPAALHRPAQGRGRPSQPSAAAKAHEVGGPAELRRGRSGKGSRHRRVDHRRGGVHDLPRQGLGPTHLHALEGAEEWSLASGLAQRGGPDIPSASVGRRSLA